MNIADYGQCLGRCRVVSWSEGLTRQRGVKALLQCFRWCRECVASAHNMHSITCVGTLCEGCGKTPFGIVHATYHPYNRPDTPVKPSPPVAGDPFATPSRGN